MVGRGIVGMKGGVGMVWVAATATSAVWVAATATSDKVGMKSAGEGDAGFR